jgi:Protein of unknown function (DUF4230)
MNASSRHTIFRWVRKPLVIALLVLALILAIQKLNWLPDFSKWFAAKPLLIDNTPLVIKEIKSISQLYTAQLYAEVVADSAVMNTAGVANTTLRAIGMPTLPIPEGRKLVLIVKGKVVAGVNLQSLGPKDIFTDKDSIAVQLPPAEILDVITNPSDIETFMEEGTWTERERTAVKNKARTYLLKEAARQRLTSKASEQAVMVMEHFLRTAGYNKIYIRTRN